LSADKISNRAIKPYEVFYFYDLLFVLPLNILLDSCQKPELLSVLGEKDKNLYKQEVKIITVNVLV
jgi:hypothetical protein